MRRPASSSFSQALRAVRRARGVAQEEFDQISSRTYVSALERGLKQPTLPKVDAFATVLQVHPLTLLALSYCRSPTPNVSEIERLLATVQQEVIDLALSGSE
jgi:transcriptional regulator with XRE-family HTH domain